MEKIEVVLYQTDKGKCPMKEFMDSLTIKMRAKVLRSIGLLQNNSFLLREPFSKALGDGIFELRIKLANNITRVLYFFVIDRKVVLTNGFVKKTQKTPQKEIELAKKYRYDYLKRKDD